MSLIPEEPRATGWSLAGHIALVTGGAQGIGRAIVDDLAGMGAQVIIADRDLDAAQNVADQLPGSVVPWEVDLADTESISRLTSRILEEYSYCDIVVNNAGISAVDLFLNSRPATWDLLYCINQRAPMQITQDLLPAMMDRGYGRLIYVSSDSARAGSSGEAAYAATKSALFGFAKSPAREIARSGITANIVCPGPTSTDMTQRHMAENPHLIGKLEQAIPLRRFGEPNEVAAAVTWLSSSRAAYVTGQTISVSGGVTMH